MTDTRQLARLPETERKGLKRMILSCSAESPQKAVGRAVFAACPGDVSLLARGQAGNDYLSYGPFAPAVIGTVLILDKI